MSTALARLAAACGIAPDYDDIWGQRHVVPDATIVALLAAMGVSAGDEECAIRALRTIDDAHDARRIAPLVVLRENRRPWVLDLRLPLPLANAPLGVRVTAEDGTQDEDARVTVLRRDAPAHEAAVAIGVRLGLVAELQPGYYQVEIVAGAQVVARTCCAIAPTACYLPAAPQDARTWGAATQLYGVRSARNWGIGDMTDLASLIDQWGARGGGIVGVNPLHALFPHDPRRTSPYSPSSRLFRNTLYLDVEAVAEFSECDDARALVLSAPFQQSLAALRDAPLVDYVGVAAAKRPVLERLFRHFRERHLAADDARAEAFRAYVAAGGDALSRHALFETLQEHFHRADADVWGWPVWPEPYRDSRSPAVAQFAAQNAERIMFYEYLQWQAEQQLAAAGVRASATGMSVGLFTDLAVSVDRGGAEAWANQDLYALGASVGAPPDAWSTKGQDWGLPPMIPGHLADVAYAPFLATLRANMRHAGALRIDHVMGLARLFWIPTGREPADGAYVRYPFDDLLGLLALESHRHRCLVIGEDLGTVPDYVRAALAANTILSYRVLIFEHEANGDFKPPAAYPADALVTASTHDLPTLAGWWAGADIELRAAQGMLATTEDRDAQLAERAEHRRRLLAALRTARLLPVEIGADPETRPELDAPLARAVQTYLAATPSRLQVVQLEDVIGVRDQANLPGTTDSHPNWCRKLPVPLEGWPDDERFDALAGALDRARPQPRKGRAPTRRVQPLHVPLATYRVQLNHTFTFAAATALVPYLAALGVSHVYCSPYLRARPGSLHGYDIIDHSALNPEIGSREDFERFVAALDAHGMGHLCDVVPNHVGVMGADNAWWMDVLENGPASACADYFDIDWSPLDADLAGRVLVPVLGDPYGVVLERGELKLAFEPAAGTFAIGYFGHRFPIDPCGYPALLGPALDVARGGLPPEAANAAERLVASLVTLPPRTVTAADALAVRRRDAAAHKRALAELAALHAPLLAAIERVVAEVNGTQAQPGSFERLHALLEAQAFRLAYWRVASDEINYRRFFDVNDLAALRMENEAVFDATHAFVLRLAAAGKIHGLRIDHPDGLSDPARYFERLQARYRQYVAETGSPTSGDPPPIYVVQEKIAASHERAPENWPISGSTGYRFANVVNGLFVAGAAKARLDRAWRAFVGAEAIDFDAATIRGKEAIMRGPLAAELTLLAHRALRVARADRRTRDFTYNALRQAIEDVVARFPVYRTYIADSGTSAQDRRYIDWAVKRARRESHAADASVFDFLRDLMLAAPPAGASAEREADFRGFAMRFQQFTSPVTAKGVEDTAFYRFNRLVALNDVGGDPDQFGTTVRAFHGASQDRAAVWPATMLATSTHDNKRSEDVRARIDVISELPAAWRLTVRRWSRLNRSRKRQVDGRDAPSRNDEYLLYQTLVGTFPAGAADAAALARYRERIERYMVKAAREAKVNTSWLGINTEYEDALVSFVAALLASTGDNLFINDLRAQCVSFAWFGMLNSLSMALIKFASPGVPDIYQGNELLDLKLVDPDNRAAVDYDVRRAHLAALESLAGCSAAEIAAAMSSWFAGPDGERAKLWITYRLLGFRGAHRALLATGDYLPIRVTGTHADHVVAFARRHGNAGAIAVAGRLFASLGRTAGTLPLGEAAWGDTALAVGFVPADTQITNVLTNEAITVRDGRVPMAQAFRRFPGALLYYAPRD